MLTKAEITQIRGLAAKKERSASGLFIAEGEKLVEELLASDFAVRRILVCAGAEKHFPAAGGMPVDTVSAKEMERISMLKTPTGVLALVEIPRYGEFRIPGRNELVLALDGIQDPGNMGTIIRLADWFGVRDIVCSENTADCFNPKVVQATMGAISRVRVHYTALEAFLARAAGEGLPLYGTFLEGENI